jgi:hypothetical protein
MIMSELKINKEVATEMLEFTVETYLSIKKSYKNVVEDEIQEDLVLKQLKKYENLIEKATGMSIDEAIKILDKKE